MWDGEWNANGGKHDNSTSTWRDISYSGRDASLSGTYSWSDDHWHVESVTGQGIASWPA